VEEASGKKRRKVKTHNQGSSRQQIRVVKKGMDLVEEGVKKRSVLQTGLCRKKSEKGEIVRQRLLSRKGGGDKKKTASRMSLTVAFS